MSPAAAVNDVYTTQVLSPAQASNPPQPFSAAQPLTSAQPLSPEDIYSSAPPSIQTVASTEVSISLGSYLSRVYTATLNPQATVDTNFSMKSTPYKGVALYKLPMYYLCPLFQIQVVVFESFTTLYYMPNTSMGILYIIGKLLIDLCFSTLKFLSYFFIFLVIVDEKKSCHRSSVIQHISFMKSCLFVCLFF